MITIKDIAKAAGVSHGTVSNVLNGKGNVSAKKIKLVEEVAKSMGYNLNLKAKALRQGSSKTIAVIMPHVKSDEYIDFYCSLHKTMSSLSYSIKLFITDGFQENEKEIIKEVSSSRVDAIILITSLENADKYYNIPNLKDIYILCVDKRVKSFDFIGFDLKKAGEDISKLIKRNGYIKVGNFDSEANKIYSDSFTFLQSRDNFDAIVTTSSEKGEAIYSIMTLLNKKIDIITLCSMQTFHDHRFIRYELNYKLLGIKSGEKVIEMIENAEAKRQDVILENDGFNFMKVPVINTNVQHINVLTLESPSTNAIMKLSKQFTNKTGVEVRFAVCSHNELYNTIEQTSDEPFYDVIRMSVEWLPWFSDKCLMPLTSFGEQVEKLHTKFIDGVRYDYTCINGIDYALPFDIGAQVLFYRKDLFENQIFKRRYLEKYKRELAVPKDFEEYNRIASFFTKENNAESLANYGSTITSGNYEIITCEYLIRLLSLDKNILDKNGMFDFDNPNVLTALKNYIETTKYSSKKPNVWWKSSVEEFTSGEAAMTIVFSNHASDIIGMSNSKIAGKIGFAPIPGGSPVLGGGVLGISKNSQKKECAFEFIKWACSEEISSMFTLLGGISPCKSIYNNIEILNIYPWLVTARDTFKNGFSRLSIFPNGNEIEERKFENIFGMAIKNAVIGLMSPEETIEYAKRNIGKLYLRQL